MKGFFYGFLNKILMANVKLIFFSTESSGLKTEMSCVVNKDGYKDIYIDISSKNDDGEQDHYTCVLLDKSTAIKLSKTLKTAINEIK